MCLRFNVLRDAYALHDRQTRLKLEQFINMSGFDSVRSITLLMYIFEKTWKNNRLFMLLYHLSVKRVTISLPHCSNSSGKLESLVEGSTGLSYSCIA